MSLCPVCLNLHHSGAQLLRGEDATRVICPTCGEFIITDEALEDHLSRDDWSELKRAALSHLLRTGRDLPRFRSTKRSYLDWDIIKGLEQDKLVLPIPTQQARNLLREIGNLQIATGKAAEPDSQSSYAIIGALNPDEVSSIAQELKREGLLALRPDRPLPGQGFIEAKLTLSGWREWEAMQQGARSDGSGFLAMQFGDERVDQFVRTHIEGTVAREIGVPIRRVDSPDISRAGVIDNIMRDAISDSAFVLVELSHGIRGAYWEAGFAEGLGKPVIYFCERAKWDSDDKPHFDVNHCTTVMWDDHDIESFCQQLAATIRNSLRK